MDQHRWQRIERLYHSALERDPEQRSSFLAQECRDDEDLRREVESLLKEDNSPAGRFLDRPAVERAAPILDETSDSGFAAGIQLGPYQLLGPLGTGGMGRVYQARDSRLGRNVAIKVSHDRFSQRFTREARAIAQLSHSNICTLYDIGPDYLVMECVEGGTLEARISSGPIPIPEAIDIAYQIAQGLRFAHAKQILHRDIKPANVMLTAEGQVKIMDFGLAKRSGGDEAVDDRTRTDDLTAAGTLLGTPAYMSPEQARGEQADQQSDVWALGVVMYEMVAGRRPFAAENSLALLRSILDDEPPRLTAVRPDCPAATRSWARPPIWLRNSGRDASPMRAPISSRWGCCCTKRLPGRGWRRARYRLREDCRRNSCTWWSVAWRRSRRSGGRRRPTYAANCCGRVNHARGFPTRGSGRRRQAGGPGSLPRWLRSA